MFVVRVDLAPLELVISPNLVLENMFSHFRWSMSSYLKEGNQSHTFEILNKWQTSMSLLFAAEGIWLSPSRFQNGGCETVPGIVYIITNVWIASEIRFDIFLLCLPHLLLSLLIGHVNDEVSLTKTRYTITLRPLFVHPQNLPKGLWWLSH